MSDEPERFYGTDVTDEFDTIAEAWIGDDGVLHLSAVMLDRREPVSGDREGTSG